MLILVFASFLRIYLTTAYTCTELTPLVCKGDSPVSILTASSIHDHRHNTSNSCLDHIPSQGTIGSWTALDRDSNQWIQVDLGSKSVVKSVITQGRQDLDQWVKSYRVIYSDDAVTWKTFLDSSGNFKVFSANNDRNTKVTNYLPHELKTRYLRLLIQTWQSYISMRWELNGCRIPSDYCPTTSCENCVKEMGYRCFCPSPYTGRQCSGDDQVGADEPLRCESHPCRNGGICKEELRFRCFCPSSYAPSNCSEKINEAMNRDTTDNSSKNCKENCRDCVKQKDGMSEGVVIGIVVVCAILQVAVLSISVYICKAKALGRLKEKREETSVRYETPDKGNENEAQNVIYQDITERGSQ